jgi:hypothetical protein
VTLTKCRQTAESHHYDLQVLAISGRWLARVRHRNDPRAIHIDICGTDESGAANEAVAQLLDVLKRNAESRRRMSR